MQKNEKNKRERNGSIIFEMLFKAPNLKVKLKADKNENLLFNEQIIDLKNELNYVKLAKNDKNELIKIFSFYLLSENIKVYLDNQEIINYLINNMENKIKNRKNPIYCFIDSINYFLRISI